MVSTEERRRVLQARRRRAGLRDIRLDVRHATAETARRQIADQVARLSPALERAALQWIEQVSEFDGAP